MPLFKADRGDPPVMGLLPISQPSICLQYNGTGDEGAKGLAVGVAASGSLKFTPTSASTRSVTSAQGAKAFGTARAVNGSLALLK